jgi:hypothetical protein
MDTPETPKTDLELLARAIRRKTVVSFTYDGVQMVAEPIVLGVHKDTGKQVLRCYKSFPMQLSDKKENWYLCDVEKIANVKITPMRAKEFRKGCKVVEEGMSEVIECSEDYMKE